jgi:outer membrane immunogenic protein
MRNRMRVLALAALFAALPSLTFAQGTSGATSGGQFVPGTKILSADLLIGGNGDYAGVGVGASFEVGVAQFGQKVTLGLGASIGIIHDSFGSSYYSVNQIPIFFIANGHYQLTQVPQLDLYGGASVGIAHVTYSYDNGYCPACSRSSSTSDVGVGAQIGGRWAFTDNLSAMAQFGEGVHVPILTAGITLKF